MKSNTISTLWSVFLYSIKLIESFLQSRSVGGFFLETLFNEINKLFCVNFFDRIKIKINPIKFVRCMRFIKIEFYMILGYELENDKCDRKKI